MRKCVQLRGDSLVRGKQIAVMVAVSLATIVVYEVYKNKAGQGR